MNRAERFSYQCGECGLCCRNKVISLSPFDLFRIARAANLSSAESVTSAYTIRRGSVLRFHDDGSCVALRNGRCSIHSGRPLACRLYPLGMEREAGSFAFSRLQTEAESAGVFGTSGSVAEFLDGQGIAPYVNALKSYESLLAFLRGRAAAMVDFDKIEPREFRRKATREALSESDWDRNTIIDALFDPVPPIQSSTNDLEFVTRHCDIVTNVAAAETDPGAIAAAAVLLAVSIGFTPAEAFAGEKQG